MTQNHTTIHVYVKENLPNSWTGIAGQALLEK